MSLTVLLLLPALLICLVSASASDDYTIPVGVETCVETDPSFGLVSGFQSICITPHRSDKLTWTATRNGETCEYSRKYNSGICYEYHNDHVESVPGYKLRCQGLTIKVCGKTPADLTASVVAHKSGSAHKSDSDEDNPIGAIFGFMLIGFFLYIRFSRRPVQVFRPIYNRVPTSAATAGTVELPVAVAEVSTEVDDDHIPVATATPVHPTMTSNQKKRPPTNISSHLLKIDPLIKEIVQEAKQGKLVTFMEAMESYHGEGLWDTRCRYVSIAGDYLQYPSIKSPTGEDVSEDLFWQNTLRALAPQLDDLEAGNNNTAKAALYCLRGESLITLAWKHRGCGWSHTVTSTQRQKMHQCLEKARTILLEAAALDPRDPTPYAILQNVALGLSGRAAGQEWLQRALHRDSCNFRALTTHSYLLSRKWHGVSDYECIDFARKFVADHPRKHPVQLLLISVLHMQYTDPAWSASRKRQLIEAPWVRETTLDIFRNVYTNQSHPPIHSFVRREMYDKMVRWLECCVNAGVLPTHILGEAKRLPNRPPPAAQQTHQRPLKQVDTMTIRELKMELEIYGISARQFVEKPDLKGAVVAARRARGLITESATSTTSAAAVASATGTTSSAAKAAATSAAFGTVESVPPSISEQVQAREPWQPGPGESWMEPIDIE
ncbi:expressed unknown protein [Seminavis robusta]|uniref:Uncharacterized protein n=1 Tax=Seminavis robusta TaxID=568900 RepID=A0A9N8H8U5_9STRA|nr:expressed unknown protein [Seminavis robusta]|eukprot:Sro252_g099560.1 n/a (664) ;mRNA; r:17484-19609